jgi:uncharacterized membrane protein YqjE
VAYAARSRSRSKVSAPNVRDLLRDRSRRFAGEGSVNEDRKNPARGRRWPEEQATEQSLNELVQRASSQTASLVRKEIRLAQVELREKGKRAGMGAGMFGGSGLVALFGVGALIAAATLALSTATTAWLAALIVAVVLCAVAGALALTGKQQVQRATPPAPEAAIHGVQRDIEEVKERAARR